MNVDLVRALDQKNADPAPGARAGKGGPGFPELMDSMLGGAADDRSAPRPRPEDEPPRAASAREVRPDRGPRSERGERSVREERASRSERGAARRDGREATTEETEETTDRAVDAEPRSAADAAPSPVRRASGARKGDASTSEEEAAAAAPAQSEVVAVAAITAVAVPELIALATAAVDGGADALEAEADMETGASETAAAGGVGALAGLLGASAAIAGDASAARAGEALDAEGGAAAMARNAVGEPGVAQKVVAALDAARDGEAVSASSVAAETPAAEVVPAAAAEARPAEIASARAEAPRAEAPRREAEATAPRAIETALRPELAGAQARGGNEGFSEDRPRDPQAMLVPTGGADRADSTSPSAAATASPIETAASTDVETLDASGRPQDVAAQARVEGMSLAPTARMPEPLSPMQTGRPMPASAPDSIAVQADWLATRGGGTARLVLHPPELGEIAIRVTVRNQSVDVVMVAHTALAHQVAEDQSDRLSQAFASRDLRLDQFEVRRGDPSDASSTGQFGSSDAGARERERAEQEAQIDRGGAGQGGRRRGAAGPEAVVAPPRIASNGRAAGIDLRI